MSGPHRPLGPPNLGNLLRDPWMLLNETVIARVHAAGYDDVRVAHAAISSHVRDEGSRVTELAERAQLTKPTVVYLVDDLEKLGYMERVPDPADGRAKLVRPTAKGKAAVEAARAAAAEIEAEWTALIGERRMRQLRGALEELRGKLWPEDATGA